MNVCNHIVFLYSFILIQFFIILCRLFSLHYSISSNYFLFFCMIMSYISIYIYINDTGHVLCHNSIYLAHV